MILSIDDAMVTFDIDVGHRFDDHRWSMIIDDRWSVNDRWSFDDRWSDGENTICSIKKRREINKPYFINID